MIIYGDPSFLDEEFDTVLNPVVVFEIHSPSTKNYDKTTKFGFYKSIPSLQQYVLIDSQQLLVEIHTKGMQQEWQMEAFDTPESKFEISSIQYSSTVAQLYEGVQLTG